MKGYMASGQSAVVKKTSELTAGLVMGGNFDVDVEQQQRIGHLLTPMPQRCVTIRHSWIGSTLLLLVGLPKLKAGR